MRAMIVSILGAAALAACGSNEVGMQFGVPVAVPAELAVTPAPPLRMPPTNALPQPIVAP